MAVTENPDLEIHFQAFSALKIVMTARGRWARIYSEVGLTNLPYLRASVKITRLASEIKSNRQTNTVSSGFSALPILPAPASCRATS